MAPRLFVPARVCRSSKGELSEKLLGSRSTVLLIDEFEKASRPVHYFFLQLLEDGWFTDPLRPGGRRSLTKSVGMCDIKKEITAAPLRRTKP